VGCDGYTAPGCHGSFVYLIGDVATFIYLTFFDGYVYNAWNWLIAIPVNFFLATISILTVRGRLCLQSL
jgi:hypothetical protein